MSVGNQARGACTRKAAESTQWPRPKSRDVGLFTNSMLYRDAINLALEYPKGVDVHLVQAELVPRLRGLAEKRPKKSDNENSVSWVGVSNRVASDLLRELVKFEWFKPMHGGKRTAQTKYTVTESGRLAASESVADFKRSVVWNLQKLYQVPGWFVDRLWKINPSGQGEVFLPGPKKEWLPGSWAWDDNRWREDLATLTREAAECARRASPDSFPISDDEWAELVHAAWDRLSKAKRKRKAVPSEKGQRVERFRPRLRLSMAMLEASVGYFFGPKPPGSNSTDIQAAKRLISARTLRLWCAKLEDLGLVFYTDNVRGAPGRLVFPVSVYREAPAPADFVEQESVQSPGGMSLFYHVPKWGEHKVAFERVLVDAHHRLSQSTGSLYVSLLDVRDEVCRRLRVNGEVFEGCLAAAFRESLDPGSPRSISLEADVREDQQSGHAQLRRQVWQEDVPYSLIAVAPR
jgi:hypothetical protein